jgi:aquaporin Z
MAQRGAARWQQSNTATGSRSVGYNTAIAVGSTVALLGLFASPIIGNDWRLMSTTGVPACIL